MNRKPLPFSFSWMGLTLVLSFAVAGWLQQNTKLIIVGVVLALVTAGYTALAVNRLERFEK